MKIELKNIYIILINIIKIFKNIKNDFKLNFLINKLLKNKKIN